MITLTLSPREWVFLVVTVISVGGSIGGFAYFKKSLKDLTNIMVLQDNRLEKVYKRISNLEKQTASIETTLDNIKKFTEEVTTLAENVNKLIGRCDAVHAGGSDGQT